MFLSFCSTLILYMYSGMRDRNEALWATGISSLLCTHTHRYNVKERALSSQQASAFVYVQSGMFLKGLVFSGGVFSVKRVLKDELTITFREYLSMKKYEFLFAVH